MGTKIHPPMVGERMWVAPHAGPIARDALEAIGMPSSDGDSIEIKVSGDRITLNGIHVNEPDATLVHAAWHCDPRAIGPDPDEELVRFTRRTIEVRRAVSAHLRLLTGAMHRAQARGHL